MLLQGYYFSGRGKDVICHRVMWYLVTTPRYSTNILGTTNTLFKLTTHFFTAGAARESLQHHHIIEVSLFLHQLVMTTRFHNDTVFEHVNDIDISDCGQPVSHDDGSSTFCSLQ